MASVKCFNNKLNNKQYYLLIQLADNFHSTSVNHLLSLGEEPPSATQLLTHKTPTSFTALAPDLEGE